jgi:hypothetical protein
VASDGGKVPRSLDLSGAVDAFQAGCRDEK